MSEYTPKDRWHGQIRQFDINEIVEGGTTGLDNIPHQQLADSLFHLKKRIEAIERSGGVVIAPNAPQLTTTDKGTAGGIVIFSHNNPDTNGQTIEITQTIKSGSGCTTLTTNKKQAVFADAEAVIEFTKPSSITVNDICEVRYEGVNTTTNESAVIAIQGAKSSTNAAYPSTVIDIVGYEDGDFNASHFQGEILKVNLTNAENGHEVYVSRSAYGEGLSTTGGWGNDGSGIVQWGVADIKGFHSKLYSDYAEKASKMYTMTYVARDNKTRGTANELLFLRKLRGVKFGKQPREQYQANAAIYGFSETAKLTDDTIDIYFIASDASKAAAEGQELTVSLFTSYTDTSTTFFGGGAVSDRPSAVDIVRAVVTNGIAHFPNIPIPKKSGPLTESEELVSVFYEVGTPAIPYTGDGTGFQEFYTTATTAICRGSRKYNVRYVTEQIEGLNL